MTSHLTMIMTTKTIVKMTLQSLRNELLCLICENQTILTTFTQNLMIINLKQNLLIVLVITYITEISISL